MNKGNRFQSVRSFLHETRDIARVKAKMRHLVIASHSSHSNFIRSYINTHFFVQLDQALTLKLAKIHTFQPYHRTHVLIRN